MALFGLSVGIPLGVIFLYALVHEGGHALLAILFGGQVTEFQVNFFVHSPHVSYVGIYDPLQKAIISLAGPVFPLILVWPLTMLMRKTENRLVQGTILLFLGNLLPTVLLSAVIALVYGFRVIQPTEDVAKFLYYSGFNPFVTSGALAFLFGVVLIFLLRVGRAKEIAAGVFSTLSGPANKRSPLLLLRIFAVLLLLPVGVGILQNIVGPESQMSQPMNYQTKIELDLQTIDADSTIYHTFEVSEPTTFDFVYSLTTQSDVTLRLLNLRGEPFVFNNKDSVIMYQGNESLPLASFSGFTLLEGTYALEASAGSQGALTMYIDSREPDGGDLHYVDLLAKVQDGTFTAQSYQEEGYTLIYEGLVPQGTDELLATFSGGGRGRTISAFVVGSSDVSLFYEADGKTHTLLDGFQATIGRGLPPHRGQGEIRVKTLEGEAILFIYVREE